MAKVVLTCSPDLRYDFLRVSDYRESILADRCLPIDVCQYLQLLDSLIVLLMENLSLFVARKYR